MAYYRLLLICLVYFIQEYTASVPVTLYVPLGGTVDLLCPFKSTSFQAQWRGPKQLTVLSTGKNVRSTLQNSDRLEIYGNHNAGEYNLRIKQITAADEGHYRCISKLNRKAVQSDFYVYIVVGPSNMRIVNATEDGIVYATEGHTIQLNCLVQSGTPGETITWKTGDSVLNVGGPMSLLYTFIPTRDENLKYFTCSARNSMKIHPLEQTVQIKVTYPPKVTIEGDDEIEVREGKSLTLICTSDYDLEYVKWIRNNKTEDNELVTTAQNVSSLSIKNISRSFTGRYECQVQNRGQVGSDSVFVKVKYTPVVHKTNSSLQFRTEINRPVNVSIRVQSFEMPTVLWVHSAGGKLSIWMTHSLHFDRTEEMFLLSSTITPLVHKHFGNYSFRIRNSEGSRDFKIFLLYIEPHIESYPKLEVYNTYQAIRLRCLINPKLYDRWSFSWMHFRNGVFIRSFDRPIVDNEARLNLSFVDYTDAGVYVCALLTHDANFTAQSLVFVEGPPIVAGKNMSAVRNDVGNIVVLSIQVYCYPKNISVTWFYEDRHKSADSSEVFVSNMKMNVTNSSVTIESYGVPVQVSGYRITVSINHINKSEGKLVCQIQNHYGIKEESFEMRDILTVLESMNKDAQHNTGSFNRIYIYGGTVAFAVLVLSISICICRWLYRRHDSGVISTAITSPDNPVINIQSDTVELGEIEDLYEEIVDEDLINIEQTNQQPALYLICLPDSNFSHALQKNNDDQALLKMDKYETCNTETEYLSKSSKNIASSDDDAAYLVPQRMYKELHSVSESNVETGRLSITESQESARVHE